MPKKPPKHKKQGKLESLPPRERQVLDTVYGREGQCQHCQQNRILVIIE